MDASPALAPIVVNHHAGAECPTGPSGQRKAFGIRATAIPPGGTVQFNITSVRRVELSCLNVPALQGVNFRFTSIKFADVDLITSANGTTTGGTQTGTGVSGTNFASWGMCQSMVQGWCLDPAVPVIIAAVNDSNAAATLQIDLDGVTV